MHHSGHTQGDGGGCTKCIINRIQIAALAPLLAYKIAADNLLSDSVSELAATANAAVGIQGALGMKPTPAPSEPCEHAMKLMAWIRDPESADASTIDVWTTEILEDIAEMVGPKAAG